MKPQPRRPVSGKGQHLFYGSNVSARLDAHQVEIAEDIEIAG
jgi:hypothetical protein